MTTVEFLKDLNKRGIQFEIYNDRFCISDNINNKFRISDGLNNLTGSDLLTLNKTSNSRLIKAVRELNESR